jgi:hypothetical protein
MQIFTLGAHIQWGSTLWGIPVPRGPEEERVVQWLNDEWVDPLPAIEKAKRGEGPYPDLPNAEDAPARHKILNEFLPRLLKLQSEPFDRSTLTELAAMLRKHAIVPTIPTPEQPATLLASGKNLTEVWAMHALLQMASDGTLKKLAPCGCGCEKWLIRTRAIDRFAAGCRVKFHQQNPEFKERRRKQSRERYRLERRGVVRTSSRKEKSARPRTG